MIEGEKEFALFHYKIHKFYHLTSNAIFPQDFLVSLIPLSSLNRSVRDQDATAAPAACLGPQPLLTAKFNTSKHILSAISKQFNTLISH